ncbi:VOC family protein [Kribbella shirazensis]|uniref:Catechol 2,3-dioxygenase-like lactoylglutathione lyase family enzyme n=1 Tax=Kribbella shirazensis TaxID=1105143 RepID=A0A7X5VFI4_9ACTN|nr:VOC family protein [Kribbella shirazensis]NIK59348.1 catechol 2,3-dioxygenase-like lactoylglutathione lyase family enzyme [Kribbella shirazensis]
MPEALLDHLVLATADLEATVAAFAAATGVVPVVGGRHARWGTRNYLVGLGGTAYLEFLGADPEPAPDAHPPYPLDRERLVTWAIHPPDADAFVAEAREQGVELGELVPLSRRTATGDLLSWRVSSTEPAPYDGLVPFLIDWGATLHPTTTGLPSAELLGLTATHPNAEQVRAVLDRLGLRLDVELGPSRLTAEVRGPSGVFRCL